MKLENEYLTDEELEQLILEVEEHELVTAPPSLLDEVLTHVEVKEKREAIQQSTTEYKVKEFQKYCIRVITSSAAAIAILFALPNVETVQVRDVPTRQEMVGKSISREEALDDTKFLTKLMNGLNNRIGGFSNEAEKEE